MGYLNKQENRYYIKAPQHPRCNYKNYVKRAVLVMEEKIGRYLKPGEVVHHINGDSTNDTVNNLMVLTIEQHSSLHHAGRRYKKDKPAWNKIQDNKIKTIREMYKTGYKFSKISRMVGVSDATIRKYCLGSISYGTKKWCAHAINENINK